jgi:hypothetical protein
MKISRHRFGKLYFAIGDSTRKRAKYSAAYREMYSEEYSGEQFENVVRREMLGKILARQVNVHVTINYPEFTTKFLATNFYLCKTV